MYIIFHLTRHFLPKYCGPLEVNVLSWFRGLYGEAAERTTNTRKMHVKWVTFTHFLLGDELWGLSCFEAGFDFGLGGNCYKFCLSHLLVLLTSTSCLKSLDSRVAYDRCDRAAATATAPLDRGEIYVKCWSYFFTTIIVSSTSSSFPAVFAHKLFVSPCSLWKYSPKRVYKAI